MVPFLHLGPLTIPTYGLMVALGMVAGYYMLAADLARRGIAPKDSGVAEMFVAIPCLAGILGAKIYSVLESPRELFADPLGQIFSRYGLTWTGGLIAGVATFLWLARRKKIPLLDMLDAGSPGLALGYAFGRMGCLLSGDEGIRRNSLRAFAFDSATCRAPRRHSSQAMAQAPRIS